jgi:hypothetical protein
MQRTLPTGLKAGACSGLLLVALFFVDYGPATSLASLARWFMLNDNAWSKLIGALLVLALATLSGALFGAATRGRILSRSQSLMMGLLAGVLWWVILVLLLAMLVRHIQFSLFAMLYWIIVSLFFGLVLGSLFARFEQRAVLPVNADESRLRKQ